MTMVRDDVRGVYCELKNNGVGKLAECSNRVLHRELESHPKME